MFTAVVSIANIVSLHNAYTPDIYGDVDVFEQPAFSNNTFGAAALWISFVTNVLATLMVGYKAWCVTKLCS